MTDERAYEEIIAELEAAVASLENEPLGLEQSLA
ncbi:MAG: exodeoxyribonuclease VII small subunit [Myxococcota bacterium]|nr:exodeoxyribonuclease VII small subunit [Myxococcota bacterium]